MGKRSGRQSEADRLREWLVFVISTENRPRTDHILARYRRWRFLMRSPLKPIKLQPLTTPDADW